MSKIDIDYLAATIEGELLNYSKEIAAKIDASSDRVGKKAVRKLRSSSPRLTGDYRRSWRMSTENGKRIVHVAAPEYRLAHLLEHGHAKRDGGRVEGRPHIKPVEEEVIREFTQEVEEAIKDG